MVSIDTVGIYQWTGPFFVASLLALKTMKQHDKQHTEVSRILGLRHRVFVLRLRHSIHVYLRDSLASTPGKIIALRLMT